MLYYVILHYIIIILYYYILYYIILYYIEFVLQACTPLCWKWSQVPFSRVAEDHRKKQAETPLTFWKGSRASFGYGGFLQ